MFCGLGMLWPSEFLIKQSMNLPYHGRRNRHLQLGGGNACQHNSGHSVSGTFRLRLPLRGAVYLAVAVSLTASWVAWSAVTVQSSSGQFVVYSPYPTTPSLGQLLRQQEGAAITLQPDTLAVGCERAKRALLRDLGLNDRWQGRIRLNIRSDLSQSGAPLMVVSTKFADGWYYSLDLPEHIERYVLLRLLLQALLLEMSNRNPGPWPPELPVWLVEGMAGRLENAVGPELIPETTPLLGKIGPQTGRFSPSVRDQIGTRAAEQLRGWLRNHPPLSFNDLSLPPPGLSGERLQTYRATAQLFLSALLELPNGRNALVQMLGLLPQRLNWQTAFLEAYRSHFQRMLAVEHWWAVWSVQFLAGSQPHSWPMELTRRKLDEVLQITVERRTATDAVPSRVAISLQELIRESPYAAHREIVHGRIAQLDLVQFNSSPDLAPLIGQYAKVLRRYAAQPVRADSNRRPRGSAVVRPNPMAQQTISRLNSLDRRRLSIPLVSPARSSPVD